MPALQGYDTETWSSNQISKGLEHYFSDPDFEIICGGYATMSGAYHQDRRTEWVGPRGGVISCAHNATFDRLAVDTAYPGLKEELWFDTMVGVRAVLGASLGRNSYISLDKSAKLLLPAEYHKDEQGAELMPYFSFPSKYNNFGQVQWRIMADRFPDQWEQYKNYCAQDANVALQLALLTKEHMGDDAFFRLVYEAEITYRMNRVGWPVDTKLLQVMADKAQENTEKSLDSLISEYNPGWSTVKKKTGEEVFNPLNLNRGAQLKKWLRERDIDIPNTQADTITETIEFVEDSLDTRPDWAEVLTVLQAKVDLGGATLKKLSPIATKLSKDGRLRDVYNHIAASSTHRTTSSGVQLQNLKRLPDDVEDLTEASIADMNNNALAKNIRQLFMSHDPEGQIIVADLKSIEGLLVGWVFGVDWMVEAVRDGKDMYKMSAAERFRVPYDTVTPDQRRTAKTGVLAGNYGGGAAAYVRASSGALDEDAAKRDVVAYRQTIQPLVDSWWALNDMLIEACEISYGQLQLHNRFSVSAQMTDPLPGLDDPTLAITLWCRSREVFSRRWHGVRLEENDQGRKEVTYAMLDERKTAAEPWKRLNTEGEPFRLYGGKLTGTLIQSLARELYFHQLKDLSWQTAGALDIIGQLHDEVVCEWVPGGPYTLHGAEQVIEKSMTRVPWYLNQCPVRVKVSHAHRYIK